jgi:hypothetical protein
MSVRNTVKSIQDIMRQDTGVDGDAQRDAQQARCENEKETVVTHDVGSCVSSALLQPSFVLDGSVNALYGDFRNTDSPRAVLAMEFFVTGETPAKPGILMQKRYAKSIVLSARSPEALVKGWNQALEEILTSLVADLKTVAAKDSR